MRVAAITFLVIVGIPIMLLLLLAAIVATAVFAVLVGINRALGFFGRKSPSAPGGAEDARRRNVRVMPPPGDRR